MLELSTFFSSLSNAAWRTRHWPLASVLRGLCPLHLPYQGVIRQGWKDLGSVPCPIPASSCN